MKRLLVLVSVGALLLLGVAINNVGDDAPVLSSDGGSPTVDGALPSLGPVELTAAAYNGSVLVPCTFVDGDNKAQCDLRNYNPLVTGFTFSGTTVVDPCTAMAPFSLVKEGCKNQTNLLRIDVDIVHNTVHLPCGGVTFGQVVLHNGMDTLTLTLVASGGVVTGCSS